MHATHIFYIMRILLFGEYSGFFTCLRDGLVELGHEVFMASNGDSFRNYPADYRWDVKVKGSLGVYLSAANVFMHLDKFSGFDVVLVISFRPLGFLPFVNKKIISFLVEHNKKVFVSAAGLDYYSFDYWCEHPEEKYNKYVSGYLAASEKTGKRFPLHNRTFLKKEEVESISKVRGLIPIMYEYWKPYSSFKNIQHSICLPINIKKFQYKPNVIKDKIVFFHGVTRACKGGELIKQAFDEMERDFGDVAEFHCKGGLPFNEYIDLLSRTNCVLDDTNAYSLGMNSLFSMAQGRIVMGGVEPESQKDLGYVNNPALNLKPDVEQIKNQIKKVIDNKEKIEEWGMESRKFVERYHDHIKVAAQYLKIFENV